MGMDASGMNMATYFMRDKIYSDKVGAVVREYASNAIDEHKKFGIDRAVQIGLRKEGASNIFFCRDYANGLDEEGVRNIFGMYFRSTKSHSNESIGGFGIGSKAGHCYSDTFYVTSYFKGEKTTYACVLGGGEDGVPIGHIYKIDSSQTEETGLEIYLEVKNEDFQSFEQTIINFVAFSPNKIEYNNFIHKDGFSSQTAIFEKEINGINFRILDKTKLSFRPQHIGYIQMGGVTYKKTSIEEIVNSRTRSLQRDYVLVVDVPIGKMSIPISRESFERTPANERFMELIKESLIQLIDEDLSACERKPWHEMISLIMHDGIFDHSTSQGKFFEVSNSVLYKDFWPFLKNLGVINQATTFQKKNDKPLVLLIPSGKNGTSFNYWLRKVKDFAGPNVNYYRLEDSNFNDSFHQEIQDRFEFISVKKLPYPKTPKSKKFSVIQRSGKKVFVNALELHNLSRVDMDLPQAQDEQEAIQQNETFFKNELSIHRVKNFVFSTNQERGFNYINSAKMREQMIAIGWLDRNSLEFKTLVEKLEQKLQQENEKQSKISKGRRKWLPFCVKTKAALSEDRNALRMSCVFSKLLEEKSLRGNLLKILDEKYAYYSNHLPISRQDLRRILSLKNA